MVCTPEGSLGMRYVPTPLTDGDVGKAVEGLILGSGGDSHRVVGTGVQGLGREENP